MALFGKSWTICQTFLLYGFIYLHNFLLSNVIVAITM